MTGEGLPRNRKLLLVASTGGHLTELFLISDLIEATHGSHWVTFEHDQSSTLLSGRAVTYVPYIAPRDIRGVLRSLPAFVRLLRRERFDAAVSTGAAIAVPALLVAGAFGVRAHYVESVSRFDGPSLAGRILSVVPSVRVYTQHRRWANRRWRYDVSIAESLATNKAPSPATGGTRLFVTLGTIKPYRFDSLVDRVKALLPADADVTWQVGATTRADLPGTVHEYLTSTQFDQLAREATTVVTHAGVGSVIHLLRLGARTLVVPRRASRGEHVDDHQLQTINALASIDGIVCKEVDEIGPHDLGLGAASGSSTGHPG
jgi:UDP-N-acetylglucosamine--N-acetylmuramyl-(pentapeptide) pyrophosphoryl-undecaprenol N-acetylglucosamine transferase